MLAGRRRDRRLMQSAANAVLAAFATVLVAVFALEYALVTHDFSLAVVVDHTTRQLPFFYLLTALWASQPGSLLLWLTVLSGAASLVIVQNRRRNRELLPWVTAVLGGSWSSSRPWRRSSPRRLPRARAVAQHGAGLDPSLQNPYMAIHPPIAVPGLRDAWRCRFVRNGGPDHRPHRRPLAALRPPLDAGRLDRAGRRHAAGRALGLRGDRVGRLLGLGSGRERRPDAVAGRHRLPALGDGAGEEGHAQGVEHGAGVSPPSRSRCTAPS